MPHEEENGGGWDRSPRKSPRLNSHSETDDGARNSGYGTSSNSKNIPGQQQPSRIASNNKINEHVAMTNIEEKDSFLVIAGGSSAGVKKPAKLSLSSSSSSICSRILPQQPAASIISSGIAVDVMQKAARLAKFGVVSITAANKFSSNYNSNSSNGDNKKLREDNDRKVPQQQQQQQDVEDESPPSPPPRRTSSRLSSGAGKDANSKPLILSLAHVADAAVDQEESESFPLRVNSSSLRKSPRLHQAASSITTSTASMQNTCEVAVVGVSAESVLKKSLTSTLSINKGNLLSVVDDKKAARMAKFGSPMKGNSSDGNSNSNSNIYSYNSNSIKYSYINGTSNNHNSSSNSSSNDSNKRSRELDEAVSLPPPPRRSRSQTRLEQEIGNSASASASARTTNTNSRASICDMSALTSAPAVSAKVGSIYKVKVTKVASYGAFISVIGSTISGLAHVKNLSRDKVTTDATKCIKTGQVLFSQCIEIDGTRICFSIKDVNQETGELLPPAAGGGGAEEEQQNIKILSEEKKSCQFTIGKLKTLLPILRKWSPDHVDAKHDNLKALVLIPLERIDEFYICCNSKMRCEKLFGDTCHFIHDWVDNHVNAKPDIIIGNRSAGVSYHKTVKVSKNIRSDHVKTLRDLKMDHSDLYMLGVQYTDAIGGDVQPFISETEEMKDANGLSKSETFTDICVRGLKEEAQIDLTPAAVLRVENGFDATKVYKYSAGRGQKSVSGVNFVVHIQSAADYRCINS